VEIWGEGLSSWTHGAYGRPNGVKVVAGDHLGGLALPEGHAVGPCGAGAGEACAFVARVVR
jgi:hypothetical protein